MTAKATVEIKPRRGLHALRAVMLVKKASAFHARVWLRNNLNQSVEINSVLNLLRLASAQGDLIEIEASGKDEQQALREIAFLLNARIDEI